MGCSFGGQSGPRMAGLTQPSRMPRSITDSGSARGGTISATGRPRSVTTTLSPEAASRTYSLSLFLRVLRPTVFISGEVAAGGCFVNLSRAGRVCAGEHGGPA